MTDGRTAGEFPDGLPKSGRGGMKGVAGSEDGIMAGRCWMVFHGLSCSLTRVGVKKNSAEMSGRTKRERCQWSRSPELSWSFSFLKVEDKIC